MRDIGKNIRTLREQQQLTQEALAERLFVTRQTLSNYENGRTRPDIEMLEKIAQELQTDVNTLLYGPPSLEEQRREGKRLLAGAVAAVLALALLLLVRRLDRAEETYDLSFRYLDRLFCRPLFYLTLGWTLLQAVITRFLPKPLTGAWVVPLRRTILVLLAVYLLLEGPFLLYSLWWSFQFQQSGSADPGFSMGPLLNHLYTQAGRFAIRCAPAFTLPGGLLCLLGVPRRRAS